MQGRCLPPAVQRAGCCHQQQERALRQAGAPLHGGGGGDRGGNSACGFQDKPVKNAWWCLKCSSACHTARVSASCPAAEAPAPPRRSRRAQAARAAQLPGPSPAAHACAPHPHPRQSHRMAARLATSSTSSCIEGTGAQHSPVPTRFPQGSHTSDSDHTARIAPAPAASAACSPAIWRREFGLLQWRRRRVFTTWRAKGRAYSSSEPPRALASPFRCAQT